jgi:hypothetical protein
MSKVSRGSTKSIVVVVFVLCCLSYWSYSSTIFNEIIHKSDVKHKALPIKEFPSGKLYFMGKKRDDVAIIHNNFITSKNEKSEIGLWSSLRPQTVVTTTTIVFMGYSTKRFNNIEKILTAYGKMTDIIDQIIFIWNNLNIDPPNLPSETLVPIRLIKPHKNSLNNRFNVTHLVKTSSIISVDDDRLISKDLINKMLQTHLKKPERLIGVDKRSYNLQTGQYLYNDSGEAIVLTGTGLVPVKYLQLYMKDENLLQYVDSNMNGEDIAMNFLIKCYSSTAPIAIKLDNVHFFEQLPEIDGLSDQKVNGKSIWNSVRSDIVRWMIKHYQNGCSGN